MESANVKDLYSQWQSAVQSHAALVRDARMHRLHADEIRELERSYLVRIDAAFARLKQAEAEVGSAAGAGA